jgi:hypothetical protein
MNYIRSKRGHNIFRPRKHTRLELWDTLTIGTSIKCIILTKNPHPILHRRGSLVAVFGVVEWLMMGVVLSYLFIFLFGELWTLVVAWFVERVLCWFLSRVRTRQEKKNTRRWNAHGRNRENVRERTSFNREKKTCRHTAHSVPVKYGARDSILCSMSLI